MPKFFKKKSETFHRFPKLPPELRIKIWTAALLSRRIIRIDGPRYHRPILIGLPEAILSTNRESRCIAEKLVQKAQVQLRFESEHREQTIRILWVSSADVVFIRAKTQIASIRVSIVDSLFRQDPIQFHACRIISAYRFTGKDHIILGELGISDVMKYEEWNDLDFSGPLPLEDQVWCDAYMKKLRSLEDLSKTGLKRGPEWLRELELRIEKSLKIDRSGDGESKSAAVLDLVDYSQMYGRVKKEGQENRA